VEPTQPLIQWAPETVWPEAKGLGGEFGHSPPSSDDNKNEWSCICSPIRHHGVSADKFTVIIIIIIIVVITWEQIY